MKKTCEGIRENYYIYQKINISTKYNEVTAMFTNESGKRYMT